MTEKPRILFIDDEELLLEGVQRSLQRIRRKDWEMTFETDPHKAVSLHAERPFEVIVTDYLMPELNGIEVATRIHEINKTSQVLMLTGAADLETAANVINSTKIFRFYTKPCPAEDLEKGIQDCLIRYHEEVSSSSVAAQYQSSVLDRLPVGVIICKKNGHVIHINQAGAEICAALDVLTVDHSNFLRSVKACYREELENCIASPENRDRAMSFSRDDMKPAVSIVISDFRERAEDKVMLLVSDPERYRAPSSEILQSIYDLPPSEANLLHHLVQGFSLKEAAGKMGVTESSARTYLKRIFSKTNTSGQPELIRSVLLTPSLQPS